MTDTYSVIDWLFNQFISLWSVIIQYWALSVPILITIFANIIIMIKGIYDNN